MKAMRWLVVLLLVLAVIPLTAKPVKAADPWASAYGDWQYRTAVTISNPNSADLTDFQVKVVLDSNWPGWSHVNSDGSDIRFATADGTTVPYWVESWDYNGQSAVIWIKVPSIPAGGSTTIYLYYGNPQAQSESDPEQVFEFFDDFDTADYTMIRGSSSQVSVSNSMLRIDATAGYSSLNDIIIELNKQASLSGDFIIEGKAYLEKPTEWIGWIVETNGQGYACGWYGWSGTKGSIERWDGWDNQHLLQQGIPHYLASQGSTQVLRWDRVNGELQYWDTDGSKVIATQTDTTYNSFSKVAIRLYKGGIWQVDWIRVRKYAEQEPSVSVSTAEEMNSGLNNHPPTAPTFLALSSGLHVGKQVTFTASGSTDEDGDDISYEYRIVDKTTGSVIRDWSSTNTWTPGSGQLYHTIEIFARAVDSKGAASDAVSRVYFVLPGETIADVPFDPGQVKSKVIFTLSSAWTDLQGMKVKLDGQDSGSGVMFLFASFNGVHWWVNITGDKVILYSDSQFGPLLVPELTYDKIGTSLWAKDYVQKLVEFAQEAGTLEGTAISPGTYIQSYDAYVAGINREGTMWAAWLRYSYTGDWGGKYIKWYLTPPEGAASVYKAAYEYYQTTDADVTYFVLDFYDDGESTGTNPEVSWSGAEGTHSGLGTASLSDFGIWLTNKTFHFYLYAHNGFDNRLIGGVRIVAISSDPAINITSGSVSRSGPSYTKDVIKINVKPLPVPTKVTFWFYDENNNPLNGVDVYLGNTFLGTFDSGQSYQLDYAGTYTFTAKKLHYVDTTVTTYVEGNAGVSFTLPLQSYDVTVRIEDEHGNPVNATLYIDNKYVGTTDWVRLSIKYGSHTFRAVDAQGYSGETTAIIDHDGQIVTITIEHPVTVTFRIYDSNSSAELTGVTLYVDGASYGSINSGDQLQFLRGLHSFKFEKDGYLTTTLTINLQSDTTLTVFLLPGSDSEEGLGTWPGMNISQWNITPINSYAKALIDSGGMFGDTIKNAIRADPLMKLLLPQLLILAIVIFILVQTQSPIAGIGGALIMQAMFTAILGEAPNLRNSSLTFMLIVFLTAWTMWDLFVNYSRET